MWGDLMETLEAAEWWASLTRLRLQNSFGHSAMSQFAAVAFRQTVLMLAVGLAFLISASEPAVAGEVRTFPTKGVDLATYRTYRILPPKVLTKSGLREDEPTVGPLIRAALRTELARKGLTEVTEGGDLEVASAATAVSIPQIEALIYNLSADGTSITGTAPLATLSRYNKEGTLYVNLIDPHTNRSVWVGLSTRALGREADLDRDINKAAQALFKKYPAIK